MPDIFSVNNYGLPEPYIHTDIITRGTFNLPTHNHDFWQIIIVTDGILNITTLQDYSSLRSGDVHILPPNQYHSLQSDSGYSQIGINLNHQHDIRGIISMMERLFTEPVNLHVDRAPLLAEQISQKNALGTPLAYAQMASLIDLFVFDCIEIMESDEKKRFDAKLIEYLNDHMSETLHLSDIAAHFYISVPHLERLCKSSFNTGVMTQLQLRRLKHAQLLLSSTEMMVQEIGQAVGYPDPAHFTGFFVRLCGISPREYRKQMRKYG